MTSPFMPIEDRFLKKIIKNDDTGCWEWQGAKGEGYGQIRFKSGLKFAHRFSYEWFRGVIPDGYDIDHLCRVHGCVNPFHLEPVTRQENVYRGDLGGRTHCKQGHEYTAETRFFDNRGKQDCTICRNDRAARYRAKEVGEYHR